MSSNETTAKIFRKSRKGCVQCKARKVKCDETHPKCNRCVRLKRTCLYMRVDVRLSRESSSSQLSAPDIDLRQNPEYKQLPMDELELLHHFTAITARVSTYEAISEGLWQITIPRLSFSHEYLMHGLLAMSALHLSHLNHLRRPHYRRLATSHQQQALRLCRPALANPDQHNGTALFASGLLNMYYAFAIAATDPAPQDCSPLEPIAQSLNLMRGFKLMAIALLAHIRTGPLNAMLALKYRPARAPPPQSKNAPYLKRLLAFCTAHAAASAPKPTPARKSLAADPSDASDTSSSASASASASASTAASVSTAAAVYEPAASALVECFAKTEAVPAGWHKSPAIFEWAMQLTPAFMDRLARGEPVAVILTAHYCCLLAQIRYYWWIQGWVERTLRVLGDLLPVEMAGWLRWPMEQVRVMREETRLRVGS